MFSILDIGNRKRELEAISDSKSSIQIDGTAQNIINFIGTNRVDYIDIGENVERLKVNEGLYKNITPQIVLQKYVNADGGISNISKDTFMITTIPVKENERYEITSTMTSGTRMYATYDKNNNVVRVYPDENMDITETKLIEISPEEVSLTVCSFTNIMTITKLPVLDA